jgi:alpha-glucosidase
VADRGYPYSGGYEEYSESGYRSPGWDVAYTVTVSLKRDTATLAAKLQNGITLVRSIYLVPDQPTLKITTTLRNDTDSSREAQIRVHPEFSIGSIKDILVEFHTRSGREIKHSLAELGKDLSGEQTYSADTRPSGEWSIVNEKSGLTVINHFDISQIEKCYLNWSEQDKNRLNFELFSVSKVLRPKETISISHEYEVEVQK